jgi:hypothetical protein
MRPASVAAPRPIASTGDTPLETQGEKVGVTFQRHLQGIDEKLAEPRESTRRVSSIDVLTGIISAQLG